MSEFGIRCVVAFSNDNLRPKQTYHTKTQAKVQRGLDPSASTGASAGWRNFSLWSNKTYTFEGFQTIRKNKSLGLRDALCLLSLKRNIYALDVYIFVAVMYWGNRYNSNIEMKHFLFIWFPGTSSTCQGDTILRAIEETDRMNINGRHSGYGRNLWFHTFVRQEMNCWSKPACYWQLKRGSRK